MGAVGKLILIALMLVVSSVLFAVILAAVDTLVLRLGLDSYAPGVYNLAGGESLQASSGAAVLLFFTLPALLTVFGRSGGWFRLMARHAKGLLVTFGASALIFVGATALATVQAAPAISVG